jgi:hypothetical protein
MSRKADARGTHDEVHVLHPHQNSGEPQYDAAFTGSAKEISMKNVRTFAGAVLILAFTGCTAQNSPGESRPAGRISGAAFLAGGPSPGIKIPVANSSLTFSRGGKLITRVSTDVHGNYAAALAPGTYQVRFVPQNCLGIKDVTVPSTPTVTVDIVCAIP